MNATDFTSKLLAIGVLDKERLGVLRRDNADSVTSGKLLLGASRLDAAQFADLLAQSHDLPRVDLDAMRRGQSLADEFSVRFLHEAALYPYRGPDGDLRLATADPLNQDAIDAIVLSLGGQVALEVATFDDIEIALDAGKRQAEAAGEPQGRPGAAETDADDADNLRDLASGAPIVRALDDIFERAVSLRASDIHIEPQRRDLRVRVRVDGMLRVIDAPPRIAPRALISRVKILSGLNIAEHRLPQDGRMRLKIRGRDFDIRVAIMPTTSGEAAILRLLDRGGRLIEFDQLGFRPRDRALLRKCLDQPHGMIVVTGPTGSGKTTTLAAALASLNDLKRKILTIEDPVEYEIEGISQSQVRPAVGLSFASALRAFLRQDPDVIMVGEIRDSETAKIAIQAALTGHLVLTTLHTNNAASAVTRLIDIGIERYLIASTLALVMGQRLVRTLCLDCRRHVSVTPALLETDPRPLGLGIEMGASIHEPGGCERCGQTGYRGRHALFEVLHISNTVRRKILAGDDDAAIERAAVAEGMATMLDDGRARCLEGATSAEEVLRVVGAG